MAYVRWQLLDGKFGIRFVAAKTRVAPFKELTVPRLELQAAVLASRLAKTILDETRLEIARIIFFSDRTWNEMADYYAFSTTPEWVL